MRRTNTRIVKLEPYQEGNDEATKERNARVYDYTRRSAIKTLEDFVLNPFNEAVFETAGKNAQESGQSEHSTHFYTGNNTHLTATISKGHSFEYEPTIAEFRTLISHWGAGQGEVIIEGGTVYIPLAKIIIELNRLKEAHKVPTTTREIKLTTLDGSEIPLADITELEVYLDAQRMKRFSPENAEIFHKARSLVKKLNSAITEYERQIMRQEGIPEKDLPETIEVDYELSDGTAARFLFYKRNVTKHGQIFDGLMNPIKQKITTATGDFVIISAKAFTEDAQYKHGRTSIEVKMETNPSREALGKLVLIRESNGNTNQRSYKILKTPEGLYVATSDVSTSLDTLRTIHTTKPTQLKVDFYSAKP